MSERATVTVPPPPLKTPGTEDIGRPKQPRDNWFRGLKDDRLEVSLAGLTTDGVPIRMRASGPKEPIWRVVEMFEEMTGREVVGDWKRPPRSGPRPLDGQLAIQLDESGDGQD